MGKKVISLDLDELSASTKLALAIIEVYKKSEIPKEIRLRVHEHVHRLVTGHLKKEAEALVSEGD